MKKLSIITVAAALLLLSACGNGGQNVQTDSANEINIIGENTANMTSPPSNENTMSSPPPTNVEDFTYTENDSGEIIITAYRGKEKDVVFPAFIDGKPVVQIGMDNSDEAVLNEEVQSVFVPAVKKIGGWGFCNCKGLNKVTLSEGIKEIDSAAFLHCGNLTSITIPKSVEVIGSEAFSECGLSEIAIPENVKIIRSGAFASCKNLKSLTLSEGLEVIGSQAFAECEKLAELTLPESLKEIGLDAFRNSGIKNVTLPDGLTDFAGARTFTDCIVTYKGEEYPPELYNELYKAVNGEYYTPPSGLPPAA